MEKILAPKFSLKNQKNETISLDSFKGKKVVLFFYPKDDTPGCTKEACSFRDNYKEFSNFNTVILGLSKDNIKSHDAFSSKHELPFPLLYDLCSYVKKKYEVFGERSTNLGGEKFARSTFLIDENGYIIKIWKNVKVTDHVKEVLETIKSL